MCLAVNYVQELRCPVRSQTLLPNPKRVKKAICTIMPYEKFVIRQFLRKNLFLGSHNQRSVANFSRELF